MVSRKVGLGRHRVSSPFEDNHREASSRISRTLSRSPCCARIILRSDPRLTKQLALASSLVFVRFGHDQHFTSFNYHILGTQAQTNWTSEPEVPASAYHRG